MIELLIIGGIWTAGLKIFERLSCNENGRPSVIYSITDSWWKGAFSPETPASTIANMIESDRNCEIWNSVKGYRHYQGHHYYTWGDGIESKNLGVRVLFPYHGRVELAITQKDNGYLLPAISDYDHYILKKAYKRFVKRRDALTDYKNRAIANNLITDRVTKGYIDTVRMIEERILHREPDTANELTALLEPANKSSRMNKTS